MIFLIFLVLLLLIFIGGLIHKIIEMNEFDCDYWYAWISISLFSIIVPFIIVSLLDGIFDVQIRIPQRKQNIENKISNIINIKKQYTTNGSIDIANINYFDTINKEQIETINLINEYNRGIRTGKMYQDHKLFFISINDYSKLDYLTIDLIYKNLE